MPAGASVERMPADPRRPPLPRARARTALLAAACAAVAAGCAGSTPPPVGEDGVARSTTNIAGAPVIGFDHDPSAACGPRAPLDDDADTELDAGRIAVVGDGALDTLCALGLQSRVVAIAAPASAAPLRYLGDWVERAVQAGTERHPDDAALRATRPDLVLVDRADPHTPDGSRDLGSLGARTVDVPTSGPWEETVGTVAEALGRGEAAGSMIGAFHDHAIAVGTAAAADQTQASVVRFDADAIEMLGPSSFAGQVLAQIGIRRPPPQRFASPTRTVPSDDLSALEGDVMYMMFAGKDSADADAGGATQGVKHGRDVTDSDAWMDLGVTEHSAFTVDDGVWARGRGLVAAGDIAADVAEAH